MFPEDTQRSAEFSALLKKQGFTKDAIGIAIIDLQASEPKIFGYNIDHFIYPASVYKVFIGAEMLRRIESGDFTFDQKVSIKLSDSKEARIRIFPNDTQQLLHEGDEVTIEHLLDVMLTQSDNTASNMLIDLVGHESIMKNIIHRYRWYGSEITRTFFDKARQHRRYQFSETTLLCARHAAEFFYLVEKEELVSSFVSQKLKAYMLHWNREGRQGLFLPEHTEYYRKGGWLETNLWSHHLLSAIKSIIQKGWAVIRWNHDAGVVTGKTSRYVIAVFTVHKTIRPNSYFPTQKLAQTIFDYMERSNR